MLKKSVRKLNAYVWKHEYSGRLTVTVIGFFLILITLALVMFIAVKGIAAFTTDHASVSQFLFSTDWDPERAAAEGGPAIGALIFIVGSITLSLLALIISTPFSISTAIYMTEISPKLGRKILQPAVEIFVGIPSVVYGWIGLSVLVPLVRQLFGGLGFSLLSGGLVLAVMIFPTITSISIDALHSLPDEFKEASYALGATRWQTIRKVLLPAAMPGMLTGIVLGLARAFGEALAVQMVIGNTIRIPGSLLDSMVNLTSVITMDMGNTMSGTLWNDALWSMALLLLILSFIFILLVRVIGSRGRQHG